VKVYCKRTYLTQNTNTYQILGKSYGESYAVWEKGKFYQFRQPQDYEKEVGVYYLIESERKSFWNPIKEKEFKKHFIDVDELRQNKINEILKNG
jgi:hypothetical protein